MPVTAGSPRIVGGKRTPVVWIGDGVSARVTGRVTVTKSRSGSLAVGGEVDGLGRVFWPF